MSIVASYLRVGAEELEAIRADPESCWDTPQMPYDLGETAGATASECLYLDKEWQILSWLCSDVGRIEERNEAAQFRVLQRRQDGESLRGEGEFETAMAEEAAAMGFTYVNAQTLPADPVLTAIQGRRGDDEGPAIENLGMAAAVFGPDEAAALAAALNGVSEAGMRERFDVSEMEVLGLPGDWEESDLDEFYIPQLERLRALYNRAASAGQHVIVILG